ncbi:PREDICTED: myosin regulatory light chain 12B-like isoform X2 [Chrysochloris asiatica]|uniref:Myosin regulatory light chain 12B-like isoform X2 n=1 Tax=Chrysochloris asiatica TaxID=185453 RepID=A0A9B0TEZ9_CHRAS|nr:PREDICTED: myosin regulatory light chain 12B-like isoform X2 [Chrysochloris asiatica]
MLSKKAKTKTKKRPQRTTSNVFAMFDQSQIQEFKEAFNMIDQNRDGFIDKKDLYDMLASLGKNPTDSYLDEDYLRELLTTMGDRFTEEEVDELYREALIDKKGNFNYIEFTHILKHGAKDKDD